MLQNLRKQIEEGQKQIQEDKLAEMARNDASRRKIRNRIYQQKY